MTMNADRPYNALEVRATEHALVMPFGRLAEIVDDPDPERSRKRKNVPPESEWKQEHSRLRALIQRPFTGAKKSNVKSYRDFIADVINDARAGDMPEITLWAGETMLRVEQAPHGVVVWIPMAAHIIAIDGETQLAARFDLLGDSARGALAPVVVRLHHGISLEAAQQIFFERNMRSVTVPAAFALTRDHTDPIIEEARRFAVMLGDDVVSQTQPNRLSLVTLRQIVLWSMHRRTRETRSMRKATTFAATLAAAVEHLDARVAELRPIVEREPLLLKPAVFIACTDARVRLIDIEAIDASDPYWGGLRSGTDPKTIASVINHIAQTPLPFESDTQQPATGY